MLTHFFSLRMIHDILLHVEVHDYIMDAGLTVGRICTSTAVGYTPQAIAREAVKPDVSLTTGYRTTYVHLAFRFSNLWHFAMGNDQEYEVSECATCSTFYFSHVLYTRLALYSMLNRNGYLTV